MSGLRLAGITKYFDDFKAVDDISLEVEEGEFITLLGPSGCGKTTTLRTIAGFLAPDAGEISIKDKIVNTIPPNRRNTGMCFQSYALFPPGRELMFSFRPEDVVPFREPFRNKIKGTIRHAIFMGNLTDLFIDVGHAVIRAQMVKGGSYRDGEAIDLSVPEEAFRVLDREASS